MGRKKVFQAKRREANGNLPGALDWKPLLGYPVNNRTPDLDDRQFEHHNIIKKYNGKDRKYETWCRPLWEWIMDHLVNPEIVKNFEWDAQKVFRRSGGKRTRIYTEPWTGNRFWDIQVTIQTILCIPAI